MFFTAKIECPFSTAYALQDSFARVHELYHPSEKRSQIQILHWNEVLDRERKRPEELRHSSHNRGFGCVHLPRSCYAK